MPTAVSRGDLPATNLQTRPARVTCPVTPPVVAERSDPVDADCSETIAVPVAPVRSCAVPRCSGRAVALGRCRTHAQQHLRTLEQRREADAPWRAWYRTARWARVRAQFQAGDPLCGACAREGRVEPWTDLDHITPHRGDPALFWDRRNLQGLCARHHGEKTRGGR